MLKGFRDFVMRGNVVDLAVAVVIGLAFGAVVTAFVDDIITPIIAAIFGKPDFSQLSFTIHHSKFLYGSFLNALLAFVFIAAAVYFFVIVPLNAMAARRQGQAAPTTRPCPFCTTEVALTATRCPACTSQIGEPAAS
ncbi:MAG TPA: large conductance mechanosensitive channel protein MscL [Actinomycetota bacterium]|jgi:large conductance mechanosensitive channel